MAWHDWMYRIAYPARPGGPIIHGPWTTDRDQVEDRTEEILESKPGTPVIVEMAPLDKAYLSN